MAILVGNAFHDGFVQMAPVMGPMEAYPAAADIGIVRADPPAEVWKENQPFTSRNDGFRFFIQQPEGNRGATPGKLITKPLQAKAASVDDLLCVDLGGRRIIKK